MSKQKSHKGKKQFGIYQTENRFAKNKARKMKKYVRDNPNDKQAADRLAIGIAEGFHYRRKTPKTPIWGHSDKHLVQLMHSIDGTTAKRYFEKKRESLRMHKKAAE